MRLYGQKIEIISRKEELQDNVECIYKGLN